MPRNQIQSIEEYTAEVSEVGWEIASAIDTFCVMNVFLEHRKLVGAKGDQGIKPTSPPCPYTMSVLDNSLHVYFIINACRIMEGANTKLSLRHIFENSQNLTFPYPRADSQIRDLFDELVPVFEKLSVVRGKCIAHVNVITTFYSQLVTEGLSRSEVRRYLERSEQVEKLLLQAIGKQQNKSRFDDEKYCIEDAARFFSANTPG